MERPRYDGALQRFGRAYGRFAERLFPTDALDTDSRRVARTSMGAAMILVLVTVALAITEFVFIGPRVTGSLILPICAVACALTPMVMRLTGSAHCGGCWLVVVGIAAMTAAGLVDAGIYSDGMLWLAAVPVVAAIIVGRRTSIGFSVLGSLGASVVYLFGPQPLGTATQHTLRLITTVAVTLFIAALIQVYERNMDARSLELADALKRLDRIMGAMPHDLIRFDAEGAVRDHVLKSSVHTQKSSHSLADYLATDLVAQIHQLRGELTDDVTPRSRIHTSQRQTLELQLVPLGDGESLLLMQDITARKNLEATKADFVSVVSHELRTPLTAIVGSLGLILGGVRGEVNPEVENSIAMAARNAAQLRRLIDDLLDLRRLDAGEMVFRVGVVDVASLIESVVGLLEPFAETHGVELEVAGETDQFVMADRQRVLQVLSNLISNAVKFTGDSARVIISVSRAGGDVLFRVVDHGDGIPKSFRKQVFQRFSQAQSDQPGTKGTGLGLAIAHQIVTRLGGTIGFETEIGTGTTFWFALPVAQDLDPNPAQPA